MLENKNMWQKNQLHVPESQQSEVNVKYLPIGLYVCLLWVLYQSISNKLEFSPRSVLSLFHF